jgi:hypothetical protein
MTVRHNAIIVIGFSILGLGGVHSAYAADPMASMPVLERSFKDFAPIGFKLGTFDVFPNLDTSVEYTSNTLQSDNNEESESIYRARAGVNGRSVSGRLTTDISGFIERLDYQKTDGFDQVNFLANAKTEYTISPVASVSGEIDIERKHQTRYQAGTIASAFDPIQIDEYGFLTSLMLNPGSIKWTASAEYENISHEDTVLNATGTPLIQSDRDRSLYSLGLRANFEKFSTQQDVGFTPFLGIKTTRTVFERRNFDTTTNQFSGIDQSNTRYSLSGGIDMKTKGKWRGSASFGYGLSNPDDDRLDKQGASVVDIDLTYLYSPLTNFIFEAERFFTDDTDSADSTLETRLSGRVVHELTRQWILSTGISYVNREFGGNLEDDTIEGNIGFTHLINNRFAVDGDVKYISRESNQQNGDYDETRAMIRLKTKF